jgi:CRP-like cAMP-binding protein
MSMSNDEQSDVGTQEPTNSVHAREVRTYRYGDFIIEEGGINNDFMVILSGQVQISSHGKRVRTASDHDILGLEDVLFKRPSMVSASALTQCRVAFYAPEALQYFLRSDTRMSERILRSVVQQLAQTTQRLVEGERKFSLDDVKILFFEDGEVIIQEGTHGTDFYKLVSTEGGLSISIHGKEIGVIRKPGEFFGEMETLLCLPRMTTVSSIGQSVVQVYPGAQLSMMVGTHPDVALQMIRDLSSRLADINRRFVEEST